jgi:hypothetical protein
MPKNEKENEMHTWTDEEIEELLRAAVMDEDAWYHLLDTNRKSKTPPDAGLFQCAGEDSNLRPLVS